MADTDVRDVIIRGARARFSEPTVVQSLTWEEFADAVIADLEAAGLVVVAAEDLRCALPSYAHNVDGVDLSVGWAGRLRSVVAAFDASRAALPVTKETSDE